MGDNTPTNLPADSEMKPNPSEIITRLATPADIPLIAHLGGTTFSTTFGYSLPPHDLRAYISSAYSHELILSNLQDQAMTTLVACPSSLTTKILGFATLHRTSSSGEPCLFSVGVPIENLIELQRLYVSPEAQGMGVGKKLMAECEAIAGKEGWRGMWLGVWKENIKAQGVYGKAGFKRCGEHDFKMGETVQRDWILWKGLEG